jgi:TRAP transporter TAXI family solute receptor
MEGRRNSGIFGLTRRQFLGTSVFVGGWAILDSAPVWGQVTTRISIVTGGTGGVYYPYGGGMANIISKYLPHVEATAEVTAASVDNCKLVGAGKADLAFIMADVGYDAHEGKGMFKEKVPIQTVAVLYSNYMHIVALAGGPIKGVADLKGKKVSTGAPGSGTEVKGLRVLEAYGINTDKDITRDRLGVTESAGALKDRKIDAFFWDGGLPTAAVLDLAATPGVSMQLLSHGDAVAQMKAKYGPVYFKKNISKTVYPNMKADVPVAAVANLLICNQKAKPDLIYQILKILFDHHKELVAVHKTALDLTLEDAVDGSPIPFHAGAIKYFKEKGMKI